jgi:radical SAM superfamily enzyme YgiQ (UPF0313 family)
MRVLFINMPIRESAPPNNVPLGIYYLISSLREWAKDAVVTHCRVVDLNVWRPWLSEEAVQHRLEGEQTPDLVCLSGLITTLRWQRTVVRMVREMWPAAKIVSGGGLATNLKQQAIEMLGVDAICVGEGEEAIRRIVLDTLAGTLKQEYQWPVVALRLEPAWPEVFGIDEYIKHPIWGSAAGNSSWSPMNETRSLNMITSRGCPYRCAFCSHDATGGKNYRMRGAVPVVSEFVGLAEKYRLNFIGLTDDNCGIYGARLLQICTLLQEAGNKVPWGAHIRFNHANDQGLLKQMRAAGCRYLGFGGESADVDILISMAKGNHPSTMASVLRSCRDADIHPNATWMCGWPGETREQLRTTVRFILKHAPENPRMFVATAYPGTALWNMVGERVLQKYGSLDEYCLALGDATLPLVNYSAMPDDEFFEVAGHATAGELEKI